VSLKEVNRDYVMKQFIAKVSELFHETIIKDAYIKQLEEEVDQLKNGSIESSERENEV
jgi:hypothetical protein